MRTRQRRDRPRKQQLQQLSVEVKELVDEILAREEQHQRQRPPHPRQQQQRPRSSPAQLGPRANRWAAVRFLAEPPIYPSVVHVAVWSLDWDLLIYEARVPVTKNNAAGLGGQPVEPARQVRTDGSSCGGGGGTTVAPACALQSARRWQQQ